MTQPDPSLDGWMAGSLRNRPEPGINEAARLQLAIGDVADQFGLDLTDPAVMRAVAFGATIATRLVHRERCHADQQGDPFEVMRSLSFAQRLIADRYHQVVPSARPAQG